MAKRVLIVGGGLAGCSVAWHLSDANEVLLFERGDRLGQEASKQNAGMLRRLGEDPYERRLAQRSHEFLSSPPRDWQGLHPGQTTGALMLLSQDPHHLEDGVSHLRALHVPIHEPREISTYRSILGKQTFCKAYFLPEELSCKPEELMEGFRRGLQRQNTQVSLKTPVDRLLINDGKVVGVEAAGQAIYGDHVVLAAGAWSSDLAATIQLNRPITPLRRSVFYTGPHPAYRTDLPWIWIDDIGLYARPFQGGFLISPCDERVDWPVSPDSWGDTRDWQETLLQEKLLQYFPGLSGAQIKRSWTGLRSFAPDRRPLLGGDPDLKGLWWAAGLGGFGLSCSIGVGEALSSWIEGRHCPWLDPRPVSPGRPLAEKWLMRPNGHIHSGELISAARPCFR